MGWAKLGNIDKFIDNKYLKQGEVKEALSPLNATIRARFIDEIEDLADRINKVVNQANKKESLDIQEVTSKMIATTKESRMEIRIPAKTLEKLAELSSKQFKLYEKTARSDKAITD